MQGSSDVLHFKVPPDRSLMQPMNTIFSDHEDIQDSERNKPANLNPSKSGPTLAKILQGKYPTQNIDGDKVNIPSNNPENPMKESQPIEAECITMTPTSSKPINPTQVEPTKSSQKKKDQENNLESKIESQENNLKRKIERLEDLSIPPPRHSSVRNYQTIPDKFKQMNLPPLKLATVSKVSKPRSVDPYSSTSWLPKKINSLLSSSEFLAPSKFKFEVSIEAANKNFELLRSNNFQLHQLLNPTEKCITNYGSEFKPVEELEGLWNRHP